MFVSHNATSDGDAVEADPLATPSPTTLPAAINPIGRAKSRMLVFILFILIGLVGLIMGGYGVFKQRDALQKAAKEAAEENDHRRKSLSRFESDREHNLTMAGLSGLAQQRYEAEATSYSPFIYLGSSLLGISILFFTIYAAVEAAISTTSHK